MQNKTVLLEGNCEFSMHQKFNAITSKAVANSTVIPALLLIETEDIQPTFGRCNSFQKHQGNTVSNIEAIVLITKNNKKTRLIILVSWLK